MYSPQPNPETLVIPKIQAFERLWVTDGLRMTAERWRSAHHYHLQRQNFHYQALNQTGIIGGLGVIPIPVPNQIKSRGGEGRWLQIQPGVAIDALGNPIVITKPETFQIKSKPSPGKSLTIHLVVQYVDPESLDGSPSDQEYVQEQYRFYEKTHLDSPDVELCRLQLSAEPAKIQRAENVYFPGENTLDFRYRTFAQSRPWGMVRIAQIIFQTPQENRVTQQLAQLLDATDALFPNLRGYPQIDTIEVETFSSTNLAPYDLLYLPYNHLKTVCATASTLKSLKAYLNQGGTLFIVADHEASHLAQLKHIKQELVAARNNLASGLDTTDVDTEINAYATEISELETDFNNTLVPLRQALKYPLHGGTLDHLHPIRRYPFLFSALPEVNGASLNLLNWGGIILSIGNLPSAWGLDENLVQPRDALRSAQELGINLLHFAWRRRHLMQLQQELLPSSSSAPPL